MKESKLAPVIIVVLAIIFIAIIVFAVKMFSSGGVSSIMGDEEEEIQAIPVINLSLDTSEENQEKVVISVVATIEDEEGISYITLPDGTQVYADNYEYEVTENGDYTFKAYAENGTSDALSITVSNIAEPSSSNPYIPEGFEYLTGEVDTGYVIQDAYGNQFVWVPVSSGILTRSTMLNSEYEESNNLATSLVNSVAKNYGFYMGRYEASAYDVDGATVAATMGEQIPWTNVTYQDAYNAAYASSASFGYGEDVITALISSYAWDTTLEWLNQTVTNYSTNTSYGNYSGTVYPTGATESDQINNICDMAGNVREWTTEIYKSSTTTTTKKTTTASTDDDAVNRVIRGGSANINKIANSRNGYPETYTDSYWGFRVVMYKNN